MKIKVFVVYGKQKPVLVKKWGHQTETGMQNWIQLNFSEYKTLADRMNMPVKFIAFKTKDGKESRIEIS